MDKDKIIITNNNRDGAKLWFENECDDLYTIHTNKDYVLEYCCINYETLNDDAEEYDFTPNDKKGKIMSFDPSGGPYISIGFEVDNKKVTRIFFKDNKTLFKLEKNL